MRDEIDPQIPYIQVHRSVARMAAQLAEPLGLTYQHVRGSLDVFWESLADRRILAKALELPEPMVLLDAAEAANRLWLAFGRQIELALVASAGVLEPTKDGKYRVRGMSRYVEMEQERLAALARSAAGGRSRSVAARLASGRFAAGAPAGPRLDAGWTPTPASHQPAASQSPAGSQVRGERREVRGETREARGDTVTATAADKFWGWAQDLRVKAGCVREAPPEPRVLSGWYSAAMLELNGDDGRLREAWLRFGDDEHWQKATPACPFRAFINAETGWRKYVPRLRAG